jgi:hypothetical protein
VIRTFGYSHPELPRVEAPVGQICGWCSEAFAANDLGVVIPHVGALPNYVGPPPIDVDDAPKELFLSREDGPIARAGAIAYHRECFMRQVVGSVAHQRKTCTCFGGTEAEIPAELTPRQEAAAAVALFKSKEGQGQP